jgi:hypothetical protein
MDIFSAEAEARFALRCEQHLREYFPEQYHQLGAEAVADSVRMALDKAHRYQLVSARDILRFLNLMYTLGFEFDRNVPWAAETLNNARFTSSSKVRLLTQRTLLAAGAVKG